jgi:phosphoribosylformimino-5-aminoimidazole carboxamide ribotide isomerase
MSHEQQRFVVAPAIDVLAGRCVRLAGGDPSRVITEGGNPASAAERFAAAGASLLHLIDLDGAFRGEPSPGLVGEVVRAAGGVRVQVGGGYRTEDAIAEALRAGAERVLIGTAALSPDFLASVAARFGTAIAVAVDVRDGRVAAEGWATTSNVAAEDLARRCAGVGVCRLLVTATARDGSLTGPDLALLSRMGETSGLPVLAAGGISSLEDIRRVREIGCEGAIVGTAVWTGRIPLGEALALES